MNRPNLLKPDGHIGLEQKVAELEKRVAALEERAPEQPNENTIRKIIEEIGRIQKSESPILIQV